MTDDPGLPGGPLASEPEIASRVREISDAAHLSKDEKNVEILWAILHWLDERRVLDEDGVAIWTDGQSGRVIAEGRRRLVRTTGRYTETEVPSSREIAASELFAQVGATPLGVVRQLQADLPHYATRDVKDGLAALERVLTAPITVVGNCPPTETPQATASDKGEPKDPE